MKKTAIKIALILFLLAVAGTGLLFWQINPLLKRLTPEISALLSRTTGRQVVIKDVSLSLFPKTAFEVANLSFAAPNMSRGSDAPQTSIGRLLLATNLPALFRGQVEVSEIAVEDVKVIVSRTARSSAAHPAPPVPAHEQQRAEVPSGPEAPRPATSPALPAPAVPDTALPLPPEAQAEPKNMLRLAVKQAALRNLLLEFRDEQASPAQDYRLEVERAVVSGIGGAQSAQLEASGKLSGGASCGIRIKGSFDAANLAEGISRAKLTADIESINLDKIIPLLAAYGIKVDGLVLGKEASLSIAVDDPEGPALHIEPTLEAGDAAITFGKVFMKQPGTPFSIKGTAQTTVPPEALDVSALSITLGSGELHAPFKFSFSPLNASKFSLQTSAFPLAELGRYLLPAALLNPSGALDASVTAALPPADAGSQLKPTLNGSAQVKDAKLNIPLGLGGKGEILRTLLLNSIQANLLFEGQTAKLHPLTLNLLGGNLSAEAVLPLEGTGRFMLAGQNLSLKEISDAFLVQSPLKFTGIVTKSSARGSFSAKEAAQSITSDFSVSAEKGAIEGINILGETIGKAGQIPGLGQQLSAIIPPKYQPLLSASNTQFDQITANGAYRAGAWNLASLVLSHSLYRIEGSGTVLPGQSVNLKAQLKLTAQLTQDMVQREEKLKLLLDKDGQLSVPLAITKEGAGRMLVLPDFSTLAKHAAANTVKEEGKKALDRIAPGIGSALDSLFK